MARLLKEITMMGRSFALLLCLAFTTLAHAKVKLSQTKPVPIPQMDLKTNITSEDVQEYVPLDMRQSNDPGYVARSVGDRAINQWWNSPEMQRTSIGQTAHNVEKSMKTEVNVRSSDPAKTNHKISFQVQALQTTATAKYQGWVDARADYNVGARQSSVELSQKFMKNKDLTLSHTASTREDVTSAGVRWNF